MRSMRLVLRCVLPMTLAGSLSCGGDSPTGAVQPPPPPPPPTVASVAVSPDPATLLVLGGTQQFQATVRDQNGAILPTATVTWTSSDEAIATVSASGLATAVSEGDAQISAVASGVTGVGRLSVIDSEARLVNGIAASRTDHDSIAVVAARTDGDLLGVIGEQDGNGGIESVRGGVLISGGDSFTYWFGDNGLPERAVFNDHILVFTNYTATTVDVTVIAPDGATSFLNAIELAGDAASRRTSSSPFASGAFTEHELWAALRGVGDGIEAIQCSSSMASASDSFGLSLLPCAGLILGAADFSAGDNEGLEASALAFTIVEGTECAAEAFDVQSCISFVANGLGDAQQGATDQVGTASTATIEVTVLTTGDLMDPDGYVLRLNPDVSPSLEIETNGDAVRWEDLLPGQYTVTLDDVADTCDLASGNPVPVSLSSGAQVVVIFVVECDGIPPVISNFTKQFVSLNSCDLMDGFPFGSEYLNTFDYTDASGDADPGGQIQILLDFLFADGSSGGVLAFMIPDAVFTVTGDGFAGSISFRSCTRWGPTSTIREEISFADAAGNLSNTLTMDTPRPPGGNLGPPAGVAGRR